MPRARAKSSTWLLAEAPNAPCTTNAPPSFVLVAACVGLTPKQPNSPERKNALRSVVAGLPALLGLSTSGKALQTNAHRAVGAAQRGGRLTPEPATGGGGMYGERMATARIVADRL